MKSGQQFLWVQRDLRGEVFASKRVSLAKDSFQIQRSDGSFSMVAVLTCHRLTNVKHLYPLDTDVRKLAPAAAVQKPAPAVQKPAAAVQKPAPSNPFTAEIAWEGGDECRRRFVSSGVPIQNPWRAGTKYHPIWQAGYDGRLLNDATQPEAATKTAAPPASLFDHDGDETPFTLSAAPPPPKKAPAEQPAPKPETPNPKPQTETTARCSVLAIDFLNLLVRAYHIGKPTENHAVRSMFQTVANAMRALRPEVVVFALDGGHKLRSELLPQYKAHRPPSPELLTEQKRLAEEAMEAAGFCAVRIPDWEADDVLASIGNHHHDKPDGVVICSSDKDLLALSGRCRIYHPWSAGAFVTASEKLRVNPGQVTDYLALCGDTSDGVPGVHGIGPKKAVQLLKDHESIEGILAAAHTSQIGGATGKALKDGRAMAMLCRRVIELNQNLPLPELTAWRPSAGWQHRLQALGLSNVAAILESLL